MTHVPPPQQEPHGAHRAPLPPEASSFPPNTGVHAPAPVKVAMALSWLLFAVGASLAIVVLGVSVPSLVAEIASGESYEQALAAIGFGEPIDTVRVPLLAVAIVVPPLLTLVSSIHLGKGKPWVRVTLTVVLGVTHGCLVVWGALVGPGVALVLFALALPAIAVVVLLWVPVSSRWFGSLRDHYAAQAVTPRS